MFKSSSSLFSALATNVTAPIIGKENVLELRKFYQPFGYHLVNIILHTTFTCLFYVWCIRINFNKEASLIAGLLFATQPIHTEAV